VQHSYRNNGGCCNAATSVHTTQGCSNSLHIQADSGVMIVEKKHQEQQSVWERKDLVLKIGSQNEKRVLSYACHISKNSYGDCLCTEELWYWLLYSGIYWIMYRYLFRISHKMHCLSITKTSCLMMLKVMIALSLPVVWNPVRTQDLCFKCQRRWYT